MGYTYGNLFRDGKNTNGENPDAFFLVWKPVQNSFYGIQWGGTNTYEKAYDLVISKNREVILLLFFFF